MGTDTRSEMDVSDDWRYFGPGREGLLMACHTLTFTTLFDVNDTSLS